MAAFGCSSDPGGADASVDGSDGQPIEECNVTAPSECPDPPVVYGDIESIIEDRCIDCHDGSGGNWPLTSYQHVADWSLEIRAAMLSCAMPPADSGINMTVEERERILDWIRCGYSQ